MNINDLTIGQVNQLMAMFGSQNNGGGMLQDYVGKYVICRSRNEGINAGTVKAIDETGVILSDARRLWFHKSSSNASWYEGVALDGLSDDSKISVPREKVISEDYSLTICSDVAIKSITEAKSHGED